MICPYCGNETQFMSTKQFYGRDYGTNIYSCKPCDAYVGTHGNSKTPLGTLANTELREYRKRAHSMFDPLWKSGKISRHAAYGWMADQMGLTVKEAHIGMFDVEKCQMLIEMVLTDRRASLDSNTQRSGGRTRVFNP